MRYTVSLFIIFNFFLFASFTEADEHEINGVKADYILVDKSEKRLSLFAESKLIKTYKVALGKKPVGHKK
jgi:murein L,D-transpeptidase YafK